VGRLAHTPSPDQSKPQGPSKVKLTSVLRPVAPSTPVCTVPSMSVVQDLPAAQDPTEELLVLRRAVGEIVAALRLVVQRQARGEDAEIDAPKALARWEHLVSEK
jgi:hypothetical protein